MKDLPLGKQHFEQIISEDLLYVDKTEIIYSIVRKSGYYFLSRPRRFGKSLLINTLKQLFLGNQELFKGLWIYDKITWNQHPVIHLDFSILDYRTTSLDKAIIVELHYIAETYNLNLEEKQSAKNCFSELIIKLSTKEKVVILIDEYDKPITDYITNYEKANEHREVLRDFYGILKPLGNKIQIAFITGITKYSKVSLFSVLNNLTDLTFYPKYAFLIGISESEILKYFKKYLQKVSLKFGRSVEEVLKQIKVMYDGYSWDGENFVYNPFSLLNFFERGEFKNYWFETGTPTFLIKALRQKKFEVDILENQIVGELFFHNFEIRKKIDANLLLFQTGYITIKEAFLEGWSKNYVLNYPNQEVYQSFIHNLIEVYTFKEPTTVNRIIIKLRQALQQKNITVFEDQLNALLSDISYHLFPFEKKENVTEKRREQEFKAWEGYFHTIIYLVLQYIGVSIKCEISKHKGRIDAIVETKKYLYVMEYKLEDAKLALQQIKDNKYATSYVNSEKEVILMGVAFDRKKREVKGIEWEIWDRK